MRALLVTLNTMFYAVARYNSFGKGSTCGNSINICILLAIIIIAVVVLTTRSNADAYWLAQRPLSL
jgi:hypothetical protein